jgi:hypothetical protein
MIDYKKILNTIKYELRQIALRNQIKIKSSKDLKNFGGTCRYRDKHIILVNSNLEPKEQIMFIINELLIRDKDIFTKEKLSANLEEIIKENL